MSRPEIKQYHSLKKRFNTDTVIVITTNEFSEPALEMADDLNVKLVNGKRLLEIICDNDARDLVDRYAPSSRPFAELSQSLGGLFNTSSSGDTGLSSRQVATWFIVAVVVLMLISGSPGSDGSNTITLETNSSVINTDFQMTQIDEGIVENTFIVFVNQERLGEGSPALSECTRSGENVSDLQVPIGAPVERTRDNGSVTIETSTDLGRFLGEHWLHSNQTKSLLMDPQTEAIAIKTSPYSDGVFSRLVDCHD